MNPRQIMAAREIKGIITWNKYTRFVPSGDLCTFASDALYLALQDLCPFKFCVCEFLSLETTIKALLWWSDINQWFSTWVTTDLCREDLEILPGVHKHIVIVSVIVYFRSCGLLFCNPMDCSLPGSSVHGISQTRILEGVDIFFFKGSFQLRDWIHVSCVGRQILYHWATREAQSQSLARSRSQ